MNNNAMGILMPDNRTLVQTQPAYRCTPGGPLLSMYHRGRAVCHWPGEFAIPRGSGWHAGGPEFFPWEIDILGDGALGAHGGSGLSAVGGTIRSGELAPGAGPIRHALKVKPLAAARPLLSPPSSSLPASAVAAPPASVVPAASSWSSLRMSITLATPTPPAIQRRFAPTPGLPSAGERTGSHGAPSAHERTEPLALATQLVLGCSDGYTFADGSPMRYNGTNPFLLPGALLGKRSRMPCCIAPLQHRRLVRTSCARVQPFRRAWRT